MKPTQADPPANQANNEPKKKPNEKKGPIRRFLKWPIRVVLTILGLFALYFLAALVLGLLPTNSDWKQSKQGKRIYVITNGVHTSFILPRGDGDDSLLRLVPIENASSRDCPYVEFGWGDRAFYLETPSWADLKLSTALNAVFLLSSSVVHVDYLYREPQPDEDTRRLTLNPEEYQRLLGYITNSFALDASNKTQRIPGASYRNRRDAFFLGMGSYHLFNTCNDWTNSGLKEAGIKTAIWSPFDKAILYHLPQEKDR